MKQSLLNIFQIHLLLWVLRVNTLFWLTTLSCLGYWRASWMTSLPWVKLHFKPMSIVLQGASSRAKNLIMENPCLTSFSDKALVTGFKMTLKKFKVTLSQSDLPLNFFCLNVPYSSYIQAFAPTVLSPENLIWNSFLSLPPLILRVSD